MHTPRSFATRLLALLLSAALTLPWASPAYALREAQPESTHQRAGLEQALQPDLKRSGLEERPTVVPITGEYGWLYGEMLTTMDQMEPVWRDEGVWTRDRWSMNVRPSSGTPLKDLFSLSFAVQDSVGQPAAYIYATNGQPDYPVARQFPGIFIFRLNVRVDKKGRRLGPLLLLASARAAKARGIQGHVTLETDERNTHARHVYESLGFQQAGAPRVDEKKPQLKFIAYQVPIDTLIAKAETQVAQRYGPEATAGLKQSETGLPLVDEEVATLRSGPLRARAALLEAHNGELAEDLARIRRGTYASVPLSALLLMDHRRASHVWFRAVTENLTVDVARPGDAWDAFELRQEAQRHFRLLAEYPQGPELLQQYPEILVTLRDNLTRDYTYRGPDLIGQFRAQTQAILDLLDVPPAAGLEERIAAAGRSVSISTDSITSLFRHPRLHRWLVRQAEQKLARTPAGVPFEFTVYYLGAATGEEVASMAYSLFRRLRSVRRPLHITIRAVEKDRGAVSQLRRQMSGNAPFSLGIVPAKVAYAYGVGGPWRLNQPPNPPREFRALTGFDKVADAVRDLQATRQEWAPWIVPQRRRIEQIPLKELMTADAVVITRTGYQLREQGQDVVRRVASRLRLALQRRPDTRRHQGMRLYTTMRDAQHLDFWRDPRAHPVRVTDGSGEVVYAWHPRRVPTAGMEERRVEMAREIVGDFFGMLDGHDLNVRVQVIAPSVVAHYGTLAGFVGRSPFVVIPPNLVTDLKTADAVADALVHETPIWTRKAVFYGDAAEHEAFIAALARDSRPLGREDVRHESLEARPHIYDLLRQIMTTLDLPESAFEGRLHVLKRTLDTLAEQY